MRKLRNLTGWLALIGLGLIALSLISPPRVHGFRLEAQLADPSKIAHLGQPLWLNISVINEGVHTKGFYIRNLSNSGVRVTCASDKHKIVHLITQIDPIDMQWAWVLFDSQGKFEDKILLDDLVQFFEPGDYTLTLKLPIEVDDYNKQTWLSTTVKIHIAPALKDR